MSEASGEQKWERDWLPEDVVVWIRGGLPVRTDPSDEYAGRCGGKTGRGYCRLAAGFGTNHPGVGRCHHHPLKQEDDPGLSPWVGEVPPEQWKSLIGANSGVPGLQGFQPEHQATELGTLSFDELILKHFDGEEQQWYRAVPDDPVALLNVVIRMRMVAMGRVQRNLARVRAQNHGVAPADKLFAQEMLLDRIAGTIARLEEAKAKYIEAVDGNESRALLRDVIKGFSDEEFAAIKQNPAALAQLSSIHQ